MSTGRDTRQVGKTERNAMIGFKAMAAGVAVAAGYVTFVNAETLTIATVNTTT